MGEKIPDKCFACHFAILIDPEKRFYRCGLNRIDLGNIYDNRDFKPKECRVAEFSTIPIVEENEKICSKCDRVLDSNSFYKSHSWCVKCLSEYSQTEERKVKARKWRDDNRKKMNASAQRWRSRNRRKAQIQIEIMTLKKYGFIKASKICTDCQKEVETEGHHEDYDKPLDLVWLCRPCHKRRHAKHKKE
jgi:hypothetical protein